MAFFKDSQGTLNKLNSLPLDKASEVSYLLNFKPVFILIQLMRYLRP